MIKTILVTGAAGFMGSHLLERLLDLKYTVVIIEKSSSSKWRIKDLLSRLKVYNLENVSIEDIFKANSIDCVIHLATYYKKTHSKEDLEEFSDTIVKMPAEILECMVKYGTKFFINAGTFFEYKLEKKKVKGAKAKKLGEDSTKEPYNLYSAFKASFSEILRYYSSNHNIGAIDLKLFSPYGPRDNEKLVVYLIKNMISNSRLEMTKCEQRWNWTYVKDIAEAFVRAVKSIESLKSGYEAINIGESSAYSIKEMIAMLEDISGKDADVSYSKPYSKDEIFYVSCNNAKAKKLLGWTPKYSLKKGLEETYNYYLKGPEEK